MNRKQSEAYNYYKRGHPDDIVLYRIGDNYVALGKDADIVARYAMPVYLEEMRDVFAFPSDDIETIARLGEDFPILTVVWRNKAGELDFPDVSTIKGKKEDY